MKKIAVCPGSFDPITVGHYDIIERASKMFDEVIVLVMVNSEKKYLFSTAERAELAVLALSDIKNVRVDITDRLLAQYALNAGACAIVKGIRGAIDCDYEMSLATINRSLTGIDSLFLPPRHEYIHISSSFVREMIKFSSPIDDIIPTGALAKIKDLIKK